MIPEEVFDRLTTLITRLARERDEARRERDTLKVTLTSHMTSHRPPVNDGVLREALALVSQERDMLQRQLERTQEWTDRWQAAAAEAGRKLTAAERTLAEVERVANILASRQPPRRFDRNALEWLGMLARHTRERGATVDAAASRAAGGNSTEGSNPSAPTSYTTKTGRVLTTADIEALANEALRGYDVSHLRDRRGSREAPDPAETPRSARRRPRVTNTPPYPFDTLRGRI